MRTHSWHTLLLPAVAIAALLATTGEAASQAVESETILVRGTVIDGATGEPLHGVFVARRGSDTGYLTHENGAFALPMLPQDTYVLHAELLGYETYEFQVTGPEPEPFVVTLRPDPILLEGIRVLANRFERRRNSIAVQVQAMDRDDLVSAPVIDLVDYMEGRFGLTTSFCGNAFAGSRFSAGSDCVLRRGRWIEPVIYIDEVRAWAGLDELRQFRPQDLYTLEVYDRGSTVLVYTEHFVERVLNGKRRLMPLEFLR